MDTDGVLPVEMGGDELISSALDVVPGADEIVDDGSGSTAQRGAGIGPPVGDGQSPAPQLRVVRDARWRQLDTNSWEVILETGMSANIPPGFYHDYYLYDQLVVGRMAFDKTCFSSDPDEVVADTVGTALVGYETTCEPVGAMELLIGVGERTERFVFTRDLEAGEC